jgi:hypothetical protein
VWWYISVIPAIWRQTQEYLKLENRLGYIVCLRSVWGCILRPYLKKQRTGIKSIEQKKNKKEGEEKKERKEEEEARDGGKES